MANKFEVLERTLPRLRNQISETIYGSGECSKADMEFAKFHLQKALATKDNDALAQAALAVAKHSKLLEELNSDSHEEFTVQELLAFVKHKV